MDARLKRLIYRCQHRGMKEVDALLGRFVGRHAVDLNDRDLAQLEALVDVPDHDLYNWITGKRPIPAAHDHDLMTRLKKFNNSL